VETELADAGRAELDAATGPGVTSGGSPLKAAGRPAALLIAHEVGEPLRAMTVFSEVAQVAGEALERILRARR